MATIIQPRDFLKQLKENQPHAMVIRSSDLLEIPELSLTLSFLTAVNTADFYDTLKKAVSEFNSAAALYDLPSLDFDDLYTKYSEYIEALKPFMTKPD